MDHIFNINGTYHNLHLCTHTVHTLQIIRQQMCEYLIHKLLERHFRKLYNSLILLLVNIIPIMSCHQYESNEI